MKKKEITSKKGESGNLLQNVALACFKAADGKKKEGNYVLPHYMIYDFNMIYDFKLSFREE